MTNEKWLKLQLFAGEGAGEGGGEGAATGAESADAGHQRLRELGVPESKIRKNRAYKLDTPKQTPAAAAQSEGQEQQPEQVPTAENPTEEPTETPSRMSWKEIMADPEYNGEMQKIIQSRLKTAKNAEEALGKLAPALEVLARKHGQDPANIDYEALAQAINNDDSFYEKKALEMGLSVETVKTMDQQKRDAERQQRSLEQQKFQQHIDNLETQATELKKVFPKFDLRAELQNPVFARLTAPDMPFSVEDAYYAVHRKELQAAAMQVTAQTVAKKISNDIQSGNRRPSENGTTGQAPSVTTFDYRSASKDQREALKKRIRSGERIVPGQE